MVRALFVYIATHHLLVNLHVWIFSGSPEVWWVAMQTFMWARVVDVRYQCDNCSPKRDFLSLLLNMQLQAADPTRRWTLTCSLRMQISLRTLRQRVSLQPPILTKTPHQSPCLLHMPSIVPVPLWTWKEVPLLHCANSSVLWQPD